jgi:hypothetical protein
VDGSGQRGERGGARDRLPLMIGVAAICAALIVPIAFAGGSGGSAKLKRQVHRLAKRTGKLTKRVNALSKQANAQGDARVTYADGQTTIAMDGNFGNPVASRISTGPLPAGAYAVFGVVNARTSFTSSYGGRCILDASASPGGYDEQQIGAAQSATSETETASLAYTTTIPDGARFRLTCTATVNDSPITLLNRKIVPIRLRSQLQEPVTPQNQDPNPFP